MDYFRLPGRPECTFRNHRISLCFLRYTIMIFLVVLVTALLSANAMAESVTLSWDPNDPPSDGYMLLVRVEGATYNYNAPAWIGETSSCRLEGLVPGTTYYMVIRAYVGKEQSGDSNEIQYPPADSSTAAADAKLSDKPTGGAAPDDTGTHTSGNVPGITNLRVSP